MNMPTREIPRDEWVKFFQTFTSEHEGWLVSLGLRGRQPGHETADIAVRDLPLREIAADLKDKEHTIVIAVGAHEDDLLRHIVSEVSHVRLTRTKEGTDSALQIESANSQTTTLKLSAPVPAQA
jgi:hypothetical protein